MFRMFRTLLHTLLIAGFLWVQAAASAHVAEHGGEDHDHHGIPCTLDTALHEDQAILPAPPVVWVPAQPAWIADIAPASVPAFSPPCRAPPARAPPH